MSTAMSSRTLRFVLAAGLVFIFVATVDARQFRYLQPIATPGVRQAALPDGARPVEQITPLTREQVEPALARVLDSWNSQALDEQLGEGFYDRSRLLDVIDETAPRDASLRLQSIQGVQTLQQYIEPDPASAGSDRLVSRVSVTARTQLEFTASDGKFTRRPGVNEFILRIAYPRSGP
jgi:hypothetical protein